MHLSSSIIKTKSPPPQELARESIAWRRKRDSRRSAESFSVVETIESTPGTRRRSEERVPLLIIKTKKV
jgi:hypothetical protein